MEYTGEEVYPDRIAVKVGKNPETIWAPDTTGDWDSDGYSVRFINNVEKGKATVIVTGSGSNIGSKTATYSIVSRNLKTIPEGFWNDISELTGLKNLLGL